MRLGREEEEREGYGRAEELMGVQRFFVYKFIKTTVYRVSKLAASTI